MNCQLKNDLKVCEKHLENVLRLNKSIEVEVSKFREVNMIAIKKLSEVMIFIFLLTHNLQLNFSGHKSKFNCSIIMMKYN